MGKEWTCKTKLCATKKSMGQWWTQRRNQKILQDKWKWKHNLIKSVWYNKNSSKREVNSDIDLLQETKKKKSLTI